MYVESHVKPEQTTTTTTYMVLAISCLRSSNVRNKTEKVHLGEGVQGKEMEVRVAIPIMYVLIKCAGLGQGMRSETRLSYLL